MFSPPGLDVRSGGGYVCRSRKRPCTACIPFAGSALLHRARSVAYRSMRDRYRRERVRHDAVVVNPITRIVAPNGTSNTTHSPPFKGQGGDQTNVLRRGEAQGYGRAGNDRDDVDVGGVEPAVRTAVGTDELKESPQCLPTAKIPGIGSPKRPSLMCRLTAPEAETEGTSSYDKLNKDHAFIIAGRGAHILWKPQTSTIRAPSNISTSGRLS